MHGFCSQVFEPTVWLLVVSSPSRIKAATIRAMPPPCTIHESSKQAYLLGQVGEGFFHLVWQRKYVKTLLTATMLVLPRLHAFTDLPYPSFHDVHGGPLSDVPVGFGPAPSREQSLQRPLYLPKLLLDSGSSGVGNLGCDESGRDQILRSLHLEAM